MQSIAPTPQGSLSRFGYAGLFLTALATLMFEILLTRIFSVTMFYHFAFLAISIAMFGMTAGAILVYLAPQTFTAEKTQRHMTIATLLLAMTVVLSFIAHLNIRIPFTELDWGENVKGIISWRGAAAMTATYLIVAVPFTCAGVVFCLALTRFPAQVSSLYACDLAGAAIGCVATVTLLNAVGDAPTVIVAVALVGALGSIFFSLEARSKALTAAGAALSIALLAAIVFVGGRLQGDDALLRLKWVKGKQERPSLHERWSSFARITVSGDPERPTEIIGWGISETYPKTELRRRLDLNIDGQAYTPVTFFDGDLSRLDYLKYDVTNIVHYIRPDARVAVIGTGGGRDVLAALAFGQPSVDAIEMNGDILDAVNERYGDFTGHLDRWPGVRFINDEGRSHLAGSTETYDIIQASLVDTWAATAAGAFVLAENSLYTVEGWRTFFDRLSPDGVLSFSRFYVDGIPGAMYRMMALAVTLLREEGVQDPGRHIAVIRLAWGYTEDAPAGIGTILVSKQPFTETQLDALERECARLEFDIMKGPRGALDPVYQQIEDVGAEGPFMDEFVLDISPPRDDRPFFFQMLRLKDVFRPARWYQGAMTFNLKAVSVLGLILAIVTLLTLLCILAPLWWRRREVRLGAHAPLLVVFSAIGFGFMLVEVSQIQRLSVFLGHPVYSLSVVLFTMLLAGGAGSLSTERVGESDLRRSALRRIVMLIGLLGLFAWSAPPLMAAFQGSPTIVRIGLAVAMLGPIALFMGMIFPLGMRLAAGRSPELTPWLWGVNGATSVCASVLAVVIALAAGISAAFLVGVFCYVVAGVAFAITRPNQ